MADEAKTIDLSKTTDPAVRVPNVLGLISNVLVLGVAILILINSSLEYDRVEEAFLFSASLADDPNPCAIPTPDVYELHLALGHSETDIFHVENRERYARDFEDALCNPPGVVSSSRTHAFARSETFAILMSNCSCLPSATDDGLTVEMRIVTELCQLSFNGAKETTDPTGFFNAKLYGDLVERVSRAYLAALPAFARLWKKVEPVEEACFPQHPFRSDRPTDECPRLAVLRDELANAGNPMQSALMLGRHTSIAPHSGDSPENDIAGFYKESMPRVDQMLYRLLALSVVAYRDQTENDGQCFQNAGGASTAQQLCDAVYSDATDFVRTGDTELRLPTLENLAPALTGAAAFASYGERMATMIPRQNRKDGTGFATYEYANAADPLVYGGDARPQARTCHMDPLDYQDYSPPPPAPVWDTTVMDIVDVTTQTPHSPKPPPSPPPPSPPVGTGPLDGKVRALVVDECAKTMRWGLWDQSRLFGLPDVVRPFVSDPRDPNGYNNRWAYDLWKKPWFDDVSTTANCRADPKFQHRAYMGFQLAMTGLWVTFAACVGGWFVGWTVPDMYVQIGTKIFTREWCKGDCGMYKENQGQLQVFRDPLMGNLTMILVSIFVLFAFSWIVFVSPSDPAFYATTTDCSVFRAKHGVFGGAYPTSARYKSVSAFSYQASGWMALAILVWIWVYDLVLVGTLQPMFCSHVAKRRERKTSTGRSSERATNTYRNAILALFGVASVIGIQVVNILFQADHWKIASQKQGVFLVAEKSEAVWLAREVRMLIVFGGFGAAGASVLSQQHAISAVEGFAHKLIFFATAAACFGIPFLIRSSLLVDEIATIFDDNNVGSDRGPQQVLYFLSWGFGLGIPAVVSCCACWQSYSKRVETTASTDEDESADMDAAFGDAGAQLPKETESEPTTATELIKKAGGESAGEPALRQLFALDLDRRVDGNVRAPLLGFGTGAQTRSQSRAHGRPPVSTRRPRHQPYATTVPGLHFAV